MALEVMSRKVKIILLLSLAGNLAIFYVAIKALEYRSHINHFLDKYIQVVDEFSERDEYADQNAALVSDTIVDNRIVFFGSQVIERWNLEKYFSGRETINRGVAGQRAAGFLLRFRPDVVDLKPRAVLIEISSYNFRPESTIYELKDYLISMSELARYHDIQPILTTVIPIRSDSANFGSYKLTDSIASYNEWIRNYCFDNGIMMADFNRILSDDTGYLPDSLSTAAIDPNEGGYRLLSEEVLRVLAELDGENNGLSDDQGN